MKRNELKQKYHKETLCYYKDQSGLINKDYMNWIEDELIKQLTLTDVVSCVCKIPEPRLKVSENGTHAYCNNCAKTYWQK
jgi:hypothetical protein